MASALAFAARPAPARVARRAPAPRVRRSRPRAASRASRRARGGVRVARVPFGVPCACPRASSPPRRRRGRARATAGAVAAAAAPLFELAVPPPMVVIPPYAAFLTCVFAVLVVAILGRDDHNMLLAQILLNAPYALTTWWLSETGHLVCFSILAARSFFGAHLSGRFDALLNCGATLGLLVITAPDVAWAWRDTRWAAWLNVAICVYRLVTHSASGDGGDTGSRSLQSWLFFIAWAFKVALLVLSFSGIGLFTGYL